MNILCKHSRSGLFPKMRIDPSEKIGNTGSETGTIKEDQTMEDEPGQDDLLCRQCMFPITREANRTMVNGAHNHTFANPYGIVFEIGCFQNAAGCTVLGQPSGEFSWFPPNQWQTAICSSCLSHVGWRFSNYRQSIFFGLILDRLVMPKF